MNGRLVARDISPIWGFGDLSVDYNRSIRCTFVGSLSDLMDALVRFIKEVEETSGNISSHRTPSDIDVRQIGMELWANGVIKLRPLWIVNFYEPTNK